MENQQDLMWFLIGFGGVIVTLTTIGFFRKSSVSPLSDPYESTVKPVVEKIEELLKMDWETYKQSKPMVVQLMQVAEVYLKDCQSKNTDPQVKWNEFYFLMNKDRIQEITYFEERQQLLKKYLEKVTLRLSLYEDMIKHEYYLANDNKYSALNRSCSAWQSAKTKYDKVIYEIDQALDAIDSAQAMETMDLFTKNKGISIMSSMSNSSASSEIDDIKPAIRDLENYLKELKIKEETIFKSVDISDLSDFMVDMFLDWDFDIMSFFTLSKLSSAEDKIKDLRRSLKPLGQTLSEQLAKRESVKNIYFMKLS